MNPQTGVIREVRGDMTFIYALFRGLLVGNTLKVCWTERQAAFAQELAKRKIKSLELAEEQMIG